MAKLTPKWTQCGGHTPLGCGNLIWIDALTYEETIPNDMKQVAAPDFGRGSSRFGALAPTETEQSGAAMWHGDRLQDIDIERKAVHAQA